MTTTTTALTVKQKTFKDLIEKAKGSIAEILPKHIDPDRMAKTMLLAMTRQPLLYECSAESILQAFMTCSELGLEPGGIRGYMYLIPFWNSRNKAYECQTIPGYRGLMQLARNSGNVSHISAHVVHANDKFRVVYGLHEDLVHEPCIDENPGVPMGVYAVAHLNSGEHQFEVMTKAEVEGIRDRSKSRDKSGSIIGPWATDTLEMWRKTAIRRLVKYLELSEKLERAIEIDDAQYEVNRGVEKASVDMAGLLNAPQERGIVIDLDQIHPAEPVPVGKPVDDRDWPSDLPPWENPEEPRDTKWVDPEEPQEQEPAPEPARESRRTSRKAGTAPEPEQAAGPDEPDLHPQLVEKLDALAKFGVTREFLESYYNSPAYEWRVGVIRGLDLATSKLCLGAAISDCFPTVAEQI